MLRAAEKGPRVRADGTWGPVKPPGATGLLPGTPSLLASWAGPGGEMPANPAVAILDAPRLAPTRRTQRRPFFPGSGLLVEM